MRKFSLILGCAFFLGAPASAVTIDWVTVGDPGNPCDTQENGCYGAVGYSYQISKYEVTNAQYAEFLNAVADTDTNALYNANMNSSSYGGITQSGSSGTFSYSVKAGFAAKPVNFVSLWDSLRFANWLENGQPTGAQGNATTEDGAYTITAAGIAANSITRNAGAPIFLTSEDEWYKAAYYDTVSTSYFLYPAGSDTLTTCAAPTAAANSANCYPAVGNVTDVGGYTGSSSPNGTFDQGGNVTEWNEAIISGSSRGLRGGSSFNGPGLLAASPRDGNNPADEGPDAGFRVASLLGPLPDADDDGVPDDADNCPSDPNLGQEDTDLDLIGDACDAFPNDPDNGRLQCFADLAACQAACIGAATDCRDGIDNDADGRVDFPADSGCDSADDATETPTPPPPPCGFGPELAVVLPVLWWLRRRNES